ncbi:MAG TPA: hypothetical protein VFP72_18750 [Kineosporiaceae bacterium]|nr:hypothetical protein [Kineosporiaceae bacterium]
MTVDTAATDPAQAPAADTARLVLGGYPHVARCQSCLAYTRDHLDDLAPVDVLIAALAYHDSCHRQDPLHGPGQHFLTFR